MSIVSTQNARPVSDDRHMAEMLQLRPARKQVNAEGISETLPLTRIGSELARAFQDTAGGIPRRGKTPKRA